MRIIEVEISSHTPLRIATGRAQRGLDAVLDPRRLPASSLKGVMRAAASEVLGLGEPVVSEVFGAPGSPSAWAWSDADLPDGPDKQITTRVRIPIDATTGVAVPGGMLHAEELWLDAPVSFTIEQIAAVDHAERQSAVLAAAAMAVKGIGASRRRGLGWTTWRPTIDGKPVDAGSLAATIIEMQEAGA